MHEQLAHGLVGFLQRYALQLPGRVDETSVLIVPKGAPIVIGQRAVALHGPGLAGDGGLFEAVEGLGIETVLEQPGFQFIQHPLCLGHIVTLQIGVEAHEAHATEYLALGPGAIGQAMLQT